MLARRPWLGAVALLPLLVPALEACGGHNGSPLFTNPTDGGAPDTSVVTGGICVPGAQIQCGCAGGVVGAQVCLQSGTGYGPCQGCSAPTDGSVLADGASQSDGAVTPTDGSVITGDGGVCTPATLATNHAPVAMLFLLDGSGSMLDSNKWTAATAALTNIFGDMAQKNDPGLYAGLIVFSDANDKTMDPLGTTVGPYPGSNDVPIAQVNTTQATALEARYGGGDMPSGQTPTGTVLAGGFGELEAFAGAGDGAKKVLILMTDGVPTDNCLVTNPGTGYATDQCVTEAAAELAKAPPAGPITTFAIGVGTYPSTDLTAFDPEFLGYLAKAGGSGSASCNPGENVAGATDLCYFEVDPSGSSSATQTSFENAINAIRGNVASCVFSFAAPAGTTIDPAQVSVTLNGTAIPQDAANGWSFDNPTAPTSVTLNGSSCATAKNTPNVVVDVLLGCP